MRRIAGGLTVLLLAVVCPAWGATYQPTTAGLRQLVADDSAALPPPYAAKLKKQERDWETGIGVTCYGTGRSKFCEPDAKLMIQSIQAHVFKMDGYWFDDDKWSVSFPVSVQGLKELGADASTPIELEQNIPQIVAPLDAKARAFNAAIKDYAFSIWNEFDGPPRSNPQRDEYQDLSIDYEPNALALPGIISISFSEGNYVHGAAHGEGANFDFNWIIAQSRHAVPADIFSPAHNWRHGLTVAAIAAFKSKLKSSWGNGAADDFQGAFSRPDAWALLKSGLRIDTSSYEICSYACGAPSVIIPWSDLRPYLKSGWIIYAHQA